MTQITLDEVKQLARLAKLSLTDEEAVKFQTELGSILGYVKLLEDVDTAGVKPTSQVTGKVNATRPDELVDYGVSQAELLQNVPVTKDRYIQVKKML